MMQLGMDILGKNITHIIIFSSVINQIMINKRKKDDRNEKSDTNLPLQFAFYLIRLIIFFKYLEPHPKNMNGSVILI